MFTEMQQDHNVALANLATATKADRESASLVSKTISELTTQIASITKQLSDAHIEIAQLQGKPKTGGGGAFTPRSANPMISKSGKKFDPMGYCCKPTCGNTTSNPNETTSIVSGLLDSGATMHFLSFTTSGTSIKKAYTKAP